MMKKRFLVTTALEDTWPEDSQSVLFLGEWCRLYSRKNYWMKMDAEIVPYHWDDREKLYEDYQYLQDLFERLLTELASELNRIHKVSHSSRYWRIIIGPWLMMFLPIICDRWSCLKIAIDSNPVLETKVREGLDEKYIPQCMEHFSVLAKSDLWNHALYSSILKFIDFKNVSMIAVPISVSSALACFFPSNNSVSSVARNLVKKVASLFTRNDGYFFIKSYISATDIIKLQLKLHQIPVMYRDCYSTALLPDKELRKIDLSGFRHKNSFEEFAKEVIPLQLPIAYLEGYKKISHHIKSNNWPKTPRLIWTSNSYYMDENFKQWAAEKVEEGTPLVIGQHGGHYGQGLFSFPEYHEIKICDHYLSWGWGKGQNKVIPIGSVKKSIEKKRRKNSQESIVLIISGTSRYSGGLVSIPISRQWVDYFNDQLQFFGSLPRNINSKVIVRLYPHDDDWSQYKRWKDVFPDSKIDECKEDFNKVLINSKMLISGWNTTTYLESMLSNVPTVLFWNPKYFEIRDNAKIDFDKLRGVGILHDDPSSAARHVKEIWGDIDAWWDRADVVSVRNEFTRKYAYSNNVVSRLCSTFQEITET